MKDVVLSIDIGGSKYIVGLVDGCGNIVDSIRGEWKELTGRGIMHSITTSARELLKIHEELLPVAIGVTIPGLADPANGIWVEACFSGVGGINVAAELTEAFGLPAYIDNDGQACALAERLYGECRDVRDFVYLTVSNGCGGAVFMKDKIYYGTAGNAGELGHITVVDGGRQCNCGAKGCLEMYAAGPAVVRNFIELGGPELIDGIPANAKLIADLAREGNKTALETYRLEGYYIGKALAAACNILNPSKVIIGGGVSLAFDLFEEAMLQKIDQSIYKNANRHLVIRPTRFGQFGGLVGGAAVAECGLKKLHGWAEL